MRPSLLILLLLLLFLSLGSNSTFVGCGSSGVSGGGVFACFSSGSNDDPCDFVVSVQVTILLDSDSSPVQGATVFIDTGPSDPINTRVTDIAGQVFWNDTSFLTGFSADCDGQDVGTVEPYDTNTSFSYDLLVTAPGLVPAGTVITIDRQTRDLEMTLRIGP
jgi:hypothetical protein